MRAARLVKKMPLGASASSVASVVKRCVSSTDTRLASRELIHTASPRGVNSMCNTARPDGRQVWVNFAVPDYDRVQVIDTQTRQVVKTLEPGKAVLHMEFTPRGEAVWISSRDANRVSVYDTASFAPLATLDLPSPSGVFFTSRAARMGF